MSFSEFHSDLAAAASSVGLTKTSLLHLICPYGEADLDLTPSCISTPSPSPTSPHGVGSLSSSGGLLGMRVPGLCQKTAESLRDRAVAIRRLIKVKMASDSDLQLVCILLPSQCCYHNLVYLPLTHSTFF